MNIKQLSFAREYFYGWLGYQFFVTPFRQRPSIHYYPFMDKAQQWFYQNRVEKIIQTVPKHFVLHRFSPRNDCRNRKKVLIAHGWMSCATWMAKYINSFTLKGYEVYAIDFPAHGEAKGLQITWFEALTALRFVFNEYGPFDTALGHSFGGSMLINAINLSGQLPEHRLDVLPNNVITLGSPTQMRSPLYHLAKRFQLSGSTYKALGRAILAQGNIKAEQLQIRRLIKQDLNIQWVCVHGKQDTVVSPIESLSFCELVPNSQLVLLDQVDHISLLMDQGANNEILKRLT